MTSRDFGRRTGRLLQLRLPHPLVLLLGGVMVAAALTWMLPSGEYERRADPATGRDVVVAGTYHAIAPAPVGPFRAFVAVPRGFVDAAEVIAAVLLVGGAWIVVERIGTLGRLVGALVRRFERRGLLAIPLISAFFATMGALENMQEEIIPLVPVLMVLGRGLGVDAVTVVAMSAGAAMVGSAFGPTNPFQAGIAMKLAQLPPVAGGALRLGMLLAAFVLWVGWTMRHAVRTRTRNVETVEVRSSGTAAPGTAALRTSDVLIFLLVVSPIAAYVYGAVALGWGFNELSAGFVIAAVAAGLLGGLGVQGTVSAYLEGMQSLLPAAMLIGVARSISVVLSDGRVIDTILHALATPLGQTSGFTAALLMIPFHALLHVAVPSVSGQAVLTMPLLVPLSDLIGLSRQVTVLAYQTGAGLSELITPTNGALMAVLLAAGVPYSRWLRFALIGAALGLLVGVAGILAVQAF
jgi:uncharacterized ion transporter superfamily protein YfcC